MYLLALSEFYAREAEGWNNVFVFDTVCNRFSDGDTVVCKEGPKECDVYGVKVKYVSHNEVRIEIGANTTEKERRLMLDYAPIGTNSCSALFMQDVLIVQQGKKARKISIHVPQT